MKQTSLQDALQSVETQSSKQAVEDLNHNMIIFVEPFAAKAVHP